MTQKISKTSNLRRFFIFPKKEDGNMENKEIIENVEEVQTTFNEDGLDVLVEDGNVENETKIEEVAE